MVETKARGLRHWFPGISRLLPPLRPTLSVTIPDDTGGRETLPVEVVDETNADGSRVTARFEDLTLGVAAEIRQSG